MGAVNSGLAGIQRIQRGTILLNAVSSNTATISAVNTSKSVLDLLGFISSTDNLNCAPRITLTNATTITADRWGTTGITLVQYQIVEYY